MVGDVIPSEDYGSVYQIAAALVAAALLAAVYRRTRRRWLLAISALLVAVVAGLSLRREIARILTLRDFITVAEGRGFRAGMLWGVLAAVLVGLMGAWWTTRRRSGPPGAGLVFTAAMLLGLEGQAHVPGRLLLGLIALAIAGIAADLKPQLSRLLPLLALPGALLVATAANVVETAWIRSLVVVTVTIGGSLVTAFDRRWRARGLALVLLPVTVTGIYFTVPEITYVAVILGAALPLVLLAWALPSVSLGAGGSLALSGLLCWASAMDGFKRPGSIVGALACLGLLVAEPLGRSLAHRRPGPIASPVVSWRSSALLIATHLFIVYVASRIAGLQYRLPAAVLLAVFVTILAIGASVVLAWPKPAEEVPL